MLRWRKMAFESAKFTEFREKIMNNVGKVILGKESVIDLVIVCFICGGHVLLEDVPGTGKTMLLRAFSKAVGGEFKRIQFTPDLLPSDLTGINFYNQKSGEFEFRPGPLFSNVVLADEINRATPRTQSSLLEAMEERQITVDGVTYGLEDPFIVMATQNPLESYGTFPLPEAQVDRFLMKITMGYAPRADELMVLSRGSTLNVLETVECDIAPEDIAYVKSEFRSVRVDPVVAGYIMDIVEESRNSAEFRLGVSTRGAIALYNASQAYAAIMGRDYVMPEDVKLLAPYILNHRVVLNHTTGSADRYEVIKRLVARIVTPVEFGGEA